MLTIKKIFSSQRIHSSALGSLRHLSRKKEAARKAAVSAASEGPAAGTVAPSQPAAPPVASVPSKSNRVRDALSTLQAFANELDADRDFFGRSSFMPSLSPLFAGGSLFDEAPLTLDLLSHPMTPRVALPLDVYESGGAYHIEADVPGLKEEDIKVTLNKEGTTLTVETNKEFVEEKDEKDAKGNILYHRVERRQGKSKRSVHLPSDADTSDIKVLLKDGILSIDIARLQNVEVEGGDVKRIPIQSEASAGQQ